MPNEIAFQCSESGCSAPALFDWCPEHAAPHIEIGSDVADEEDDADSVEAACWAVGK